MPKRVVYTKITPLAANIPRQLALDMLHSHGEIIALNPLVTGHKPIDAPRDASRDEYFAQWYEIEEVITWGFGLKKQISFNSCFHNLPNGLQTHTYAPMNVDLRNKYIIAGNQPGEPREVRELGIDAPAEGLYLREDVEITCNIALASYVKRETKQTLETMIERMTKKAELLDDGELMAMFENGRLKTLNPRQKQTEPVRPSSFSTTSDRSPSTAGNVPPSPITSQSEFAASMGYTKYSQLPGRMNTTSGRNDDTRAAEMLNYSGSSAFQSVPVEMEGSPYVVVEDKSHYPTYANENTQFTAELADTSTSQLAPRRLSGVSFASSNRSTGQQPVLPQDHLVTTDPGHHAHHRHRASSGGSGNHQPHRPDQDQQNNQQRNSGYHVANPTPVGQAPPVQGLTDQVKALNINKPQQQLAPPPPIPQRKSRCPMDKCEVFGTPEEITRHVNRHHFV